MLQNASTQLTSKTDLELVNLIRTKADSDAFVEVCKRYENIFYKICQKYVTRLSNCGIDPQDIFDEKTFILLHCVSTFKPSKKTKLGTWIGNYARYLCLNSINERRFIVPTSADEDIKKYIEDSQVKTNFLEQKGKRKEEFKYILNLLKQLKDTRIADIFKLRYLSHKKMTWSQIASKMRISTQTSINLHNRGLELLRRKLKSDNISDVI